MSKLLGFFKSPLGACLTLLSRLIVATVFAFAGWPKLLEPDAFAESILNYNLVSPNAASLIASFLPTLELTVAASLLSGVGARGASALAAGMLSMFSLAIGQAIFRGIDIDCGCFGDASSSSADWTGLVRNALLILLALVGMLGPATLLNTLGLLGLRSKSPRE
ncbi:MAG: MauE/DoxX family redox-associated membrane protein [Myxococcota bacterium]